MSRSREILIANVSWWAGWCTDHEAELPELTQLSGLLLEVKDQMRMDRPDETRIEQAAKALYESEPQYLTDEAAGVITGPKPWEWLGDEYRDHNRAKVRLILEAVGPVGTEQKK